MDLEQINPKKSPLFCCGTCNYTTSSKKDFNKHESTRKHLDAAASNQIEPIYPKKSQLHVCKLCMKEYQSKSGLWNHAKKCLSDPGPLPNPLPLDNIMTTIDETVPSINLNVLVIDLLKQNQELQKQLIELSKEKSIVMNNCNNNNTNHFNLQLFLNETCKDALTADQFVENIQITNGDLENVGNQGYVQGITDIIMKQLRTLDVTKRPFHCTDVKRETIYIKDADAWKKDTDEKSKLKNVIEKVATKGRRKVTGWQRSHPEVAVLDSNDYEMNHKILRHTWGDGDTEKLQDKVIKNLAKEVHIDRGVGY